MGKPKLTAQAIFNAKIPPRGKICLTQAIERLVRLHEATSKKDEADEWRKEPEQYRNTSGNAAKK